MRVAQPVYDTGRAAMLHTQHHPTAIAIDVARSLWYDGTVVLQTGSEPLLLPKPLVFSHLEFGEVLFHLRHAEVVDGELVAQHDAYAMMNVVSLSENSCFSRCLHGWVLLPLQACSSARELAAARGLICQASNMRIHVEGNPLGRGIWPYQKGLQNLLCMSRSPA